MTDRALRKLPRHDRPHQLDVVGAALMVGAALALMLAMTLGRHALSAGRRGRSWRLLAGSAALWVLFALRLAHRAGAVHSARDAARAGRRRHRHRRASSAIGAIIGLSIFCRSISSWCWAFSPSGSGIALIAFMAAPTLGSFIAGRLIGAHRHYKRVPIVGLVARHRGARRVRRASRRGCRSVEVVALLFVLGGAGSARCIR